MITQYTKPERKLGEFTLYAHTTTEKAENVYRTY